MKALDRLATFTLWSGIVVFSLVGALGVLASWFEFTWMYPVDVGGDLVTVRNQQRFLKALELSWGVALFTLRKDVFVDPRITRLVLFLFWVTPVSRVLSMALDGLPHAHFVALVTVELTAAFVLTARAVYAPGSERRRGLEPSRVGRPARA